MLCVCFQKCKGGSRINPCPDKEDNIKAKEITEYKLQKPKTIVLKNSTEISLCLGTMEPADLINANHRRLLGNACPGASQVTLLFFIECLSLLSETKDCISFFKDAVIVFDFLGFF